MTFDLIVNDEKVPQQGGRISGNEFEWKFDGIREVHSLKSMTETEYSPEPNIDVVEETFGQINFYLF